MILVRESGSRSHRQNVRVAHRLGAAWNSPMVGGLSENGLLGSERRDSGRVVGQNEAAGAADAAREIISHV